MSSPDSPTVTVCVPQDRAEQILRSAGWGRGPRGEWIRPGVDRPVRFGRDFLWQTDEALLEHLTS